MEKDKETEEKKLRDLTTEKDAKGGVSADASPERPVQTMPPTYDQTRSRPRTNADH